MNHKPWRTYLMLSSPWHKGMRGVLSALFIALLWYLTFPLKDNLNSYHITLEILLLTITAAVLGFILPLRISALSWGWIILLYSLWLDFIEEFTHEPVLWHVIAVDAVKALGLILIGFGFYHACRLFKRKPHIVQEQARHDTLTGLPNQTLLQDHLEQAITEALRNRHQFALLCFDLDRFKEINNSLGHEVGDAELIRIAGTLHRYLGTTATALRIGGDEFAIIQAPILNLDEAALLARRVLKALSESHTIQSREIHLGASMGVALFPGDARTAKQLLKNANIAMNHAKRQGCNNYQLYTPAMNTRTLCRMTLAEDLRKAFEAGNLYLQFQPQLSLPIGTITSFEALLRWHHPQHGILARQAFIRLAEETGLIVPIGAWVLETACRACFSWQQLHSVPLRIAINLSPCQFRQPDLADSIATILASTGLSPDSLEIEITEGLLLEDINGATATLQILRRLGVHIAIDDFGTGHSSLTYLKHLPLDSIKIDRSFVCDIPDNTESQAITKAIIALGHSLDLRVVAEGVETLEQLLYFRELGCDSVQGYFISKPLDSAEVQQWWEEKGETQFFNIAGKEALC